MSRKLYIPVQIPKKSYLNSLERAFPTGFNFSKETKGLIIKSYRLFFKIQKGNNSRKFREAKAVVTYTKKTIRDGLYDETVEIYTIFNKDSQRAKAVLEEKTNWELNPFYDSEQV
jgi:hypothetical protein